ncbi:hypothetical protein ACWDTQ_31150 [Streptomyces cellulosae]
MLTATFTEPVPRGAHDATTPAALKVDHDQLDDFAIEVIEHLWPHLTGHGVGAVHIYLGDDQRSGWATDGIRTFATFTVDRSPHTAHHRRGDHHPMSTPTQTATRCGAHHHDDTDGIDLYCELAPFHDDRQHKASIPPYHREREAHSFATYLPPAMQGEDYPHADCAACKEEPQGAIFWDVDELHRLPGDVYGTAGTDGQPGEEGLYHLLKRLPLRRFDIAVRLEEQYGRERAEALLDEAERDLERDEAITAQRVELHEKLTDALEDVAAASRALRELQSPGVYDVEYADTIAADDVETFLADSRRMLRAAMALLPTDADGETILAGRQR